MEPDDHDRPQDKSDPHRLSRSRSVGDQLAARADEVRVAHLQERLFDNDIGADEASVAHLQERLFNDDIWGAPPSDARASSPTRAGAGTTTTWQMPGGAWAETTTPWQMPAPGMPLRKKLCYLTIGVVVLVHVLSGSELFFPAIAEPGRSCMRVLPFLHGVVKAPDTTTVDSSALQDKESLFDATADKLPVCRGVLHPPFPLG